MSYNDDLTYWERQIVSPTDWLEEFWLSYLKETAELLKPKPKKPILRVLDGNSQVPLTEPRGFEARVINGGKQ